MRVAGKVTLITGATSGIGEACALAFAREGARVVVAGVDQEAGDAVVTRLRSEGAEALYVQADIRQEAEVQAMVEQSLDHFGTLDILIANAGIGARRLGDGPAHTCSTLAWDEVMAVNLRGTFLCCRAALPALIASRGNLITVASVLGMVGSAGLFDTHAYAASKAGIIGLTRAIAAHYARDGVRANALAPGLVETRMATRTRSDPALLAELSRWQPLGGLGKSEDVAQAALFLASDQAKFVTGVVLPVDGGWTVQ
ncbi:SDR family NAD(P)-dependent oxidoreductase [Deinococcus sp.]|uniref:SDR family NAD(P)-dependent oxidoreductase n=1 Tax=Deinococcus sp. TaxID=47478 RepID=UPI003CC5A123